MAYVGFCFVAFLVASLVYRHLPERSDARYVAILGAGLIDNSVPPLLAARLDTAVEVADRQSPPAILVPSGGQGPDEDRTEGEAMAEFLATRGVEEGRILVEDRARNTSENIAFSRKLCDDPDAPVVVVTNSFHVFRAALLTRQQGVNAIVRGARTAPYYVPSAFLREFVAVMRMHLPLNLALVGLWGLMTIVLIAESMRGLYF